MAEIELLVTAESGTIISSYALKVYIPFGKSDIFAPWN